MIEKYLMKFKNSYRWYTVVNIITQLVINNVTRLVEILYIGFWNIENIFLSFPCIHIWVCVCVCEWNEYNLNSLAYLVQKLDWGIVLLMCSIAASWKASIYQEVYQVSLVILANCKNCKWWSFTTYIILLLDM